MKTRAGYLFPRGTLLCSIPVISSPATNLPGCFHDVSLPSPPLPSVSQRLRKEFTPQRGGAKTRAGKESARFFILFKLVLLRPVAS